MDTAAVQWRLTHQNNLAGHPPDIRAAVAAAPVLIHLLSRRRYRQMDWAAMQFLLAAVRESRRRVRLEHLLLLLVRTLVIVLLVLAVADPYLESSGVLFVPGGPRTHRVLVLDGSYSMAYTPAERSRFCRSCGDWDG